MAFLTRSYARALYEISADKTKAEVSALVENFMKLLAEKHQLGKAGEIVEEIERFDNEVHGRIQVKITSAHRLDEEVLAKIERELKRRTDAKEIVWEKEIDHALLGGVIVAYGDTVLDMAPGPSVGALGEGI